MGGYLPTYVEVKNESDIANEWSYHLDPRYDSWKLLAEFHNTVADRIHESLPDMQVGGPTSAWLMIDRNNFDVARDHLRFMDLTAGHLDFYSHHFYDSKELIVNDPQRPTAAQGFLSGRLEAVLDLFRNHMVLTDNVKPIVISESGSLHEGASDIDHWIRLKTFNSYRLRYLNRPNEFDMVVPFFLPVMWWRKDCPSNLYRYDENGQLVLTKERYFLDMWQDYAGTFVPCDSDDDLMYTHAVLEDNVLRVAVNNMNPYRTSLDLDIHDIEADEIVSATQTRLYLENGELIFETVPLESLKAIPLAVEETSIITVTFGEPLEPWELLTEKTYYGDKTLRPTGKPVTFTVDVPAAEAPEKARLRVSLGRENGFKGNLDVSFNGKNFTVSLDDANLQGAYFGYKEIEIPAELVQETNTVTVYTPIAGGYISSVALVCQYVSDAPLEAATTDQQMSSEDQAASKTEIKDNSTPTTPEQTAQAPVESDGSPSASAATAQGQETSSRNFGSARHRRP